MGSRGEKPDDGIHCSKNSQRKKNQADKKKPTHGGERAIVNQRKVTTGRFVSLGSVSEMIKAGTKRAGREFSRCKKNKHV